ncbi:MAG: peptide ABC transporter substrate-binding protein [Gemmatimonadota bacterium]
MRWFRTSGLGPTRVRRQAPLGPVVSALVLAAAGCGGAPAGDGDRTTLTILDPDYEAIFNPSWSMPARFLVFSPLVGIGEDGNPEPHLARRWERSEDGREWTFHLRSDARWHDGAAFTAGDVAFTLRIMSDPAVGYRTRPDTVIVVNDSTVTIRRKRPWNALDDWWWVYYPEHLLGDVEPSDFFASDFWTRPVGTGPFRYVRHEPRTVFVLEANPDYFAGPPGVGGVRIRFGGGSPLLELRKGSVDAARYVSRAQLPRFRQDPDLRVYHQIYPDLADIEALVWNHRHPFLGNAVVRRAMAMAIDREELRRLLHLPEALPHFDVLFTRSQFWAGQLPAAIPYDPTAARALLQSAGWRDDNGDGVRSRGADAARFTALMRSGGSSATSSWETSAVYIQAGLREIGVAMEISRLESGLTQRVRAGEFEAAFDLFNRIEAPLRLWSDGSPMGYHDPELTEILAAADTLLDSAVRDSLYRRAWPILTRDLPVLFLAPQIQHFAIHRRVRGLSSPYRADPYMSLGHAWLEDDTGPNEPL